VYAVRCSLYKVCDRVTPAAGTTWSSGQLDGLSHGARRGSGADDGVVAVARPPQDPAERLSSSVHRLLQTAVDDVQLT
jgi:hypothetical protein